MAVVDVGGRQYQVSPGDTIRVQKLDSPIGEEVVLDKVLMIRGDRGKVTLGDPLVSKAEVRAKVTGEGRERKVIAYKYKRRKGYHRKHGHRQPYSTLLIEEIVAPGRRRKTQPEPEAASSPEAVPEAAE